MYKLDGVPKGLKGFHLDHRVKKGRRVFSATANVGLYRWPGMVFRRCMDVGNNEELRRYRDVAQDNLLHFQALVANYCMID